MDCELVLRRPIETARLTRRSAGNVIADFATVPFETARLRCREYFGCMAHKNARKESGQAIRDSVRKEMAKPRMARSASIAELDLDTSRIAAEPIVTMPGTVEKIIP